MFLEAIDQLEVAFNNPDVCIVTFCCCLYVLFVRYCLNMYTYIVIVCVHYFPVNKN